MRLPFHRAPIIENKMLHGRNLLFVLKFPVKSKHILSFFSSPVFYKTQPELMGTNAHLGYKCDILEVSCNIDLIVKSH